jgi:hypothetical protein
MKLKILITVLTFLLVGCTEGERNYNRVNWEYNTKRIRLNYYNDLLLTRSLYQTRVKILEIDSMLAAEGEL